MNATTRTGLLLFAGITVSGHQAWSQGNPLGPEFRVNTYTTSDQMYPVVASDSTKYVIVWQSYTQDGWGRGVFGQRYASNGVLLGSEFRVNSYTTEQQTFPAVTSDASGNFVVVWVGNSTGYAHTGIFGQRYDTSGVPLGSEFRVNSSYAETTQPSVAADAVGDLIVIWTGLQDGSLHGIFGQRYDSSGAPVGTEFRVNTYTTNNQYRPAVAADPSGNFVVVWASNTQDGSIQGVFSQRYAGSGVPLGPEFRVNTYTSGDQSRPAVAADAAGNFIVVWDSYQDGSYLGVCGRRFDPSGAPLGVEFRVNTETYLSQFHPAVASDSAGNFVVAWQLSNISPVPKQVFAQRFAASGVPSGPEFRVPSSTLCCQGYAAVAADPSGNFVIVWQRSLLGSDYDVFGQRYGRIFPVELIRFGVE